ncbi:MAG: hypothetical protein L3J82_07065 [Planctomycetes bacterium]|nr:hypothetical protein [Planctomycetota bacterium]
MKISLYLLTLLFAGVLCAGEQQLKTPRNDSSFDYEQLGYFEVADALETGLGGVYAFLVYTRTRKGGGSAEMLVRSKFAQSTLLSPKTAGEAAWEMNEDGESMKLWGNPFKPRSKDDVRRVEYRFYQKGGVPEKLEIYVVARDKEGKAKPAETLTIIWNLPEYQRPPVLKLPKDQRQYRYTELGYLEAKDAIETGRRGVYAWLVYIKEDTIKSTRELHVMAYLRPPGNTYFTAKQANQTAEDLAEQGTAIKLWGPSFHGLNEKDLRVMEYRRYQKDGKPERFEIYCVTRNKDGTAKPAKSLSIDWPLGQHKAEQNPLARTPKDGATYTYKQLGYVEGKDALDPIDRGIYAYVIYTKTHRQTGEREVRIQTNVQGSTYFTEKAALAAAKKMQAAGKPSKTWGSPPFTGDRDGDIRKVEYRLHQKDGKPTRVTISIVLRDRNGKAKPEKRLEVDWPWK